MAVPDQSHDSCYEFRAHDTMLVACQPRLLIWAMHAVSAGAAASGVMVAFDGMRVPLTVLPSLPAVLPAVRCVLEGGAKI